MKNKKIPKFTVSMRSIKNWKTLRKTLKLELKLANRALKDSVKYGHYDLAVEYNQQWFTVNWVLKEMDAIEETGEAL